MNKLELNYFCLRGLHGLSSQRTKSKCPEGLQLEVGARRLLVSYISLFIYHSRAVFLLNWRFFHLLSSSLSNNRTWPSLAFCNIEFTINGCWIFCTGFFIKLKFNAFFIIIKRLYWVIFKKKRREWLKYLHSPVSWHHSHTACSWSAHCLLACSNWTNISRSNNSKFGRE